MTTVGDGLFQWGGVPVASPYSGVFGTHYFVDYRNGSDTDNNGKTPSKAFKTLSKAYDTATSNNNDVIHIDGDSTVAETSMITWSKNRIHVFGDNGPLPIYGQGAGAKVSMGVTTAAGDTATIRVTGVRNTFNGIKFINNNTLATCLHCVEEAGEYNRYNNCEIYKSTLLTTDLTAELLMNGDSSTFTSCTIGSLVDERGAAGKERPCVKLDRETVTGKVCRDGVFVDCRFLHKAAHVDACFVYGKNATDVERSLIFVRPIMFNCVLATADPANAINFAAAQTAGDVLVIDPAYVNTTIIGGASLNIYVTGAVPTENTSGKAVEVTS
jgi:hypothetical protein